VFRLICNRYLIVFIFCGAMCASGASAQQPQQLGYIQSDTTRTLFGIAITALGDQNGDGDGFDDFITADARPATYMFGGFEPFQQSLLFRLNSSFQVVRPLSDLNSDGSIDFAVLRPSGPLTFRYDVFYGGPLLDTIRDDWFGFNIDIGARTPIVAHDFLSDGHDELALINYEQEKVLFFNLKAPLDSAVSYIFEPINTTGPGGFAGVFAIATGDFNADGEADLAVNYQYSVADFIAGEV